jgi:hypothetical protein
MAMNSTRRKANDDADASLLAGESQSGVSQLPMATRLPHVICPSAVYTVDDLRRFLGLKMSSVRREVRLKRLRIAKRCGRYFCLGQWVLQWIEGGELKSPVGPTKGNADRNAQDEPI